DAQRADVGVLLVASAVACATGPGEPAQDGDRAALFRTVAVVVKGDSAPHLYTVFADGAPAELPGDHLHAPVFPDLEDGFDDFVAALGAHFTAGARVGVDDQ